MESVGLLQNAYLTGVEKAQTFVEKMEQFVKQ